MPQLNTDTLSNLTTGVVGTIGSATAIAAQNEVSTFGQVKSLAIAVAASALSQLLLHLFNKISKSTNGKPILSNLFVSKTKTPDATQPVAPETKSL